MAAAQIGAIISGVIGAVFVAIGLTQLSYCGGGASLLLFGIGLAFFGGSVAMFGGLGFLVPFGLLGLLLVALGVALTYGAGCQIVL